MQWLLARKVGYKLIKKGELGCPDCVYCVVNKIIEPNLTIRHSRYCTKYDNKPCVAKDCICDKFLKIRSGTETAA